MPGAGFSGKDGTVKIASTDIYEIRNWKFNPKSNNPKYASNRTSGYKRTVAGVKEGSGSMSGAWDHTNDFLAVVNVGTSATLKLYTDATHFFSVPSVIDDVSVNVDVDNGEIVSWDANFSANGAWTNPAAPMTAPAGFGERQGYAGRDRLDAPPIQEAGGFTADQMRSIADIAASSALAAVQAFFDRMNPNVNPNAAANSAQNSEPGEAVVMAEPGGAAPGEPVAAEKSEAKEPKLRPMTKAEFRAKQEADAEAKKKPAG